MAKDKIKLTKVVWVCEECGSEDIEERAWVDVKTGKLTETLVDNDGTCFCRNCNDISYMTDKRNYLDMQSSIAEENQ